MVWYGKVIQIVPRQRRENEKLVVGQGYIQD